MICDEKHASIAGVIGFQDQYSWRMACGTERQIQAQLLKENICHFLIEALRASCFRCDLSELDLGNWLRWECSEDRCGQEEQVWLVEMSEVLEVLLVLLICLSPSVIPHHITVGAGNTVPEKQADYVKQESRSFP